MFKVVFFSRSNFQGFYKDPLPTHALSNLVYEFSCYCGSGYVGKTTQTLMKRTRQHVPACVINYGKAIKNSDVEVFKRTKKFTSVLRARENSSIAQHLVDNEQSLLNFNFDRFRIIARGRNHFHLDVMESIHITTKKPKICKQLEFCYKLLLL